MNFLKNILLLCLLGLADSCIPTFNPDFDEELLTTTQKACPTNWILFNDYCYLFVWPYKNTADAEANCVAQGAHLASIHSQAENDFIAGVSDDFYVLGLTAAMNNFGTWTDGTPADFSLFYPGFGSNGGVPTDDCGFFENAVDPSLTGTLATRRWYATPCAEITSSSVCKKPL